MRWKWVLGVIGFSIVGLIVILYLILISYDFNKLKPQIQRSVREATGRELTLEGDFKVKIGLAPTILLDGVRFQNAPWGSRPDMVRVKQCTIRISLIPLIRGEIHFKRLLLNEPNIFLEKDSTGRMNTEFQVPAKPEPEEKKKEGAKAFLPLIFDEIRIEKGTLTYKDERQDKVYSLKLNSLNASLPGGESPTKINLEGSFNGRPLVIQATIGPIAALVSPDKPCPIKVSASFAEAVIIVEGSIRNGLKNGLLDLTIHGEGPSVQKVAGFAGITGVPDFGPFSAFAHFLSREAKIYQLSGLKSRFGESDLEGAMELNFSGYRPKIGAELFSQKLDLRPLWTKKENKEGDRPAPPAAQKDKIFSKKPIPLEWLNKADAHVKIRAGRLFIPRLQLTDLAADVRIEEGSMGVKPFQFAMSGGDFSGHLNLRSEGLDPAFALNLKVDRLNLGSLLAELEVKPILEGKLNAEIGLNGRGRSLADWMAGLNGRTLLVLSQGGLHNKYLELVNSDLAHSILQIINPFKKEETYTGIHCLVNGFEIKDGLAICSALVLDSELMSVVGGGQIDLKEEKLNLFFHPSPKKGIGAEGLGKISLSLGELANPFKLGGTLAKPSLAIDPQGTLITLGKAVGGIALFGPAGVLAALANISPGDKNPCLTAIEAAEKAGKLKEGKGGKGVQKDKKSD